jgi:hypothetical protein
VKIVFEQDEGTEFFEIQLTEREIKDLLSYKGFEEKLLIKKRPTSIYVRRISNATIEGEEQGNYF